MTTMTTGFSLPSPVAAPAAAPVPQDRWQPLTQPSARHAAPQPSRRVAATAPADGLGVEALLHPPGAATSVLDVDPRLLVVQHRPPLAPLAPARRSLAAPVDDSRDERNAMHRRFAALGGAMLAAVGVGASIAVALG